MGNKSAEGLERIEHYILNNANPMAGIKVINKALEARPPSTYNSLLR